ncbi:MaoC/PaaZ C-terminal domain-containing protein [Pseudonocardia sp. CA-107938]|uniref:MaoC/PaaZ C-terminal domain-containing protein n=1 Tax=Pseudonocardia sp. CA-107938 TaxID=3240021 RepID=UPI003D9304B8
MRARTFTVGDRYTRSLVEDLTRTRLVQYAGASGDFNPLHSDERHAREAAGLPGVFAHGMLTMAMTGTLLGDVVGIENVTRFGGRFKAQVWPGDSLSASLSVTAASSTPTGAVALELDLRTVNQHGVEVFTATARAVVDDQHAP